MQLFNIQASYFYRLLSFLPTMKRAADYSSPLGSEKISNESSNTLFDKVRHTWIHWHETMPSSSRYHLEYEVLMAF